jgi:hypothetical protein
LSRGGAAGGSDPWGSPVHAVETGYTGEERALVAGIAGFINAQAERLSQIAPLLIPKVEKSLFT